MPSKKKTKISERKPSPENNKACEYVMKTKTHSDKKIWHLCDLMEGTCFYDPYVTDLDTLPEELMLYIVGSGDATAGNNGKSIQCWDTYENDVVCFSADMVVIPIKTELRVFEKES